MNIEQKISNAGRNLHTIILVAREQDGSVETREAEPYSYRIKNNKKLFYCYDIKKQDMRCFDVRGIISVEETQNSFEPRWPVEV